MMCTSRGLSTHVICNKTCSTNECDSCSENPNKRNNGVYHYVSTSGEYIPEKLDAKKLTNFEKQKQKESWRAIQNKHGKRR